MADLSSYGAVTEPEPKVDLSSYGMVSASPPQVPGNTPGERRQYLLTHPEARAANRASIERQVGSWESPQMADWMGQLKSLAANAPAAVTALVKEPWQFLTNHAEWVKQHSGMGGAMADITAIPGAPQAAQAAQGDIGGAIGSGLGQAGLTVALGKLAGPRAVDEPGVNARTNLRTATGGAIEGATESIANAPTSKAGAAVGGAAGTVAGYSAGGPVGGAAGGATGAAIGSKVPAIPAAVRAARARAAVRLQQQNNPPRPAPAWQQTPAAPAAVPLPAVEPIPGTLPSGRRVPGFVPAEPAPAAPEATPAPAPEPAAAQGPAPNATAATLDEVAIAQAGKPYGKLTAPEKAAVDRLTRAINQAAERKAANAATPAPAEPPATPATREAIQQRMRELHAALGNAEPGPQAGAISAELGTLNERLYEMDRGGPAQQSAKLATDIDYLSKLRERMNPESHEFHSYSDLIARKQAELAKLGGAPANPPAPAAPAPAVIPPQESPAAGAPQAVPSPAEQLRDMMAAETGGTVDESGVLTVPVKEPTVKVDVEAWKGAARSTRADSASALAGKIHDAGIPAGDLANMTTEQWDSVAAQVERTLPKTKLARQKLIAEVIGHVTALEKGK